MERTLRLLLRQLENKTGKKMELLDGELVEARAGGSLLGWALGAVALFLCASAFMGTRKYRQLTKRNFL